MIPSANKSFDGTDARYRGSLSSTTWSLCVGAGISAGLIPTWQELARRVVNAAFRARFDPPEFEGLLKQTRWSLDALIQGAENRLAIDGKSKSEFNDILEQCIYFDLFEKAGKLAVGRPLIEALNNPRWLNKDELTRLIGFFEGGFPDSTLVQLSKALAAAKEKGRGPMAVINFNADTLLYALLDMFLIREHCYRIGEWQHPRASFAKMLRGIEGSNASVTPIFHCHGAIAPMPRKLKKAKRRDSRDHLVFCEQDYLDIAGTVGTWSQSLFLYHAQSSRLLIVGHSLSDLNIRKWLGWSTSNSMKEISAVSSSSAVSPRHVWVTKKPLDPKIREIQEVSLLHLGVRICWIEEWAEIGAVLKNLLALRS